MPLGPMARLTPQLWAQNRHSASEVLAILLRYRAMIERDVEIECSTRFGPGEGEQRACGSAQFIIRDGQSVRMRQSGCRVQRRAGCQLQDKPIRRDHRTAWIKQTTIRRRQRK